MAPWVSFLSIKYFVGQFFKLTDLRYRRCDQDKRDTFSCSIYQSIYFLDAGPGTAFFGLVYRRESYFFHSLMNVRCICVARALSRAVIKDSPQLHYSKYCATVLYGLCLFYLIISYNIYWFQNKLSCIKGRRRRPRSSITASDERYRWFL